MLASFWRYKLIRRCYKPIVMSACERQSVTLNPSVGEDPSQLTLFKPRSIRFHVDEIPDQLTLLYHNYIVDIDYTHCSAEKTIALFDLETALYQLTPNHVIVHLPIIYPVPALTSSLLPLTLWKWKSDFRPPLA